MDFMTNLISMVASWDLMPHGTFSPAARQSKRAISTCCNCDEIGTTNRSPAKLLYPMTMARRTFRLVKSVNGIGRRMTSFIEKLIENVIRRVVPGFSQSLLRFPQPRLSFAFVSGSFLSLNGDNNLTPFHQRQWSRQLQDSVFVNGIHRGGHGDSSSMSSNTWQEPLAILRPCPLPTSPLLATCRLTSAV